MDHGFDGHLLVYVVAGPRGRICRKSSLWKRWIGPRKLQLCRQTSDAPNHCHYVEQRLSEITFSRKRAPVTQGVCAIQWREQNLRILVRMKLFT